MERETSPSASTPMPQQRQASPVALDEETPILYPSPLQESDLKQRDESAILQTDNLTNASMDTMTSYAMEETMVAGYQGDAETSTKETSSFVAHRTRSHDGDQAPEMILGQIMDHINSSILIGIEREKAE